MTEPKLSIVILSYNTKNLLKNCLKSLQKVKNELPFEIVIVDNASTDKSVDMLEKNFKWVKIIKNKSNLGFAAGNNKAKNYCKGEYILFLNSDTELKKNVLLKSVDYLEKNKNVGALSCKIVLPDGKLDKDARRSFITPWIGLVHLVFKLDRIFPKSKIFGKYWYGYIPENETHEVDAIQGAFFLTRKKILDDIGWFDEDYFLDGEDIDLCWKIKKAGWKIIYYPQVSILHIKGASKGKKKSANKNVSLQEKIKYRMSGVNSMEIFVRKRLSNQYSPLMLFFVILGIRLVRAVRFIKVLIIG